MSFVVFLDVDGVLNTSKSCVVAPSGKYVGIVEFRLKLLGDAMRYAGCDGVVLTTTWKNLRKDNEDYIYLKEGLEKYGIKILGETKEKIGNNREDGILAYLDNHKDIEDFVILDDNHYGFEDYSKLWERFLDTEGQGIECAKHASSTPSISAIIFMVGIKRADDNYKNG